MGGRPGSPENVSSSRGTPRLHQCKSGVALKQESVRPPYTGVPRPLWARNPPKSLKKVFPGLRARSVKKVSKNESERLQNQCSWTFLTLRAGRRGNAFLRLFGGFRGSGGVWRLLYMGIAIAALSRTSPVFGCAVLCNRS